MSTFKKILKWVGITLGVLIGIVIIIIVLMLIFPDLKIFNHRFVRQKTIESEIQTYVVDDGQLYNLVANTSSFDIEIAENDSTNTIDFSYTDTKWGFAEIRSSSLYITQEGNTIEARMLETSGLVFGSGILKITLPSNAKYNLNLNTKSGNIKINKADINSITASLNTGKLTWLAQETITTAIPGEVDPANPDIEPEPTYKEEVVNIEDMSIDSIYIFSKTASLDLSCFKNLTVNKKMLILADSIKLNFDNLTANLYINCTKLNLNVKNFSDSGESQIITKSGNIDIAKLSTTDKATIIGESTNIKLGESNSITYIATTSGNVEITENNLASTIETSYGNVNIAKSNEDITVSTKTGNIVITEYFATAILSTETGNISTHDKGNENAMYFTKITQKTGSINHITENNRVNINSQNGSNITLIVRNMPLNNGIRHNIYNEYGVTNISIMTAEKPFKVRAVGNVSGELASSVVMTSNTEYINYIPANFTGSAPEQASLNAEGGNIHFTGLYE